jgi:xylulokinase
MARTHGALFLGLDVGTQGAKALLIDAGRGEVAARASSAYGLIAGLPSGAAEQHPETWIGAIRGAARELWRAVGLDPRRIAGVGVSGQQHGLVVLDGSGEVVRPAKLWCDTSTAEEARELSERLGRPIPAGFTASKVLWLARREPASWARVRAVLLPHDYVNLRLTGRRCMEFGDASGTGFFDPERRRFDERACAAIDARLAELLPPLLEPGAPAGELSREGAELLGLPAECAGIPVAAGGGDNMMSALGSGVTAGGRAGLSLGTSATVFAYSARPLDRTADQRGIANFCDSTGGWLPLLCVMNATGVVEEVRAAFGAGLEELTAEAREVPAGCGGVLFHPYLLGERVPDLPHASGALSGLRPGSLRRGVLFRAALEGVSLNLAWGLEGMRTLGPRIDELRLVGGGAKNALWRQILADALEVRVTLLAEGESAALGAALQALWTSRRLGGEAVSAREVAEPWIRTDGAPLTPDPRRSALYRELGQRFRVKFLPTPVPGTPPAGS